MQTRRAFICVNARRDIRQPPFQLLAYASTRLSSYEFSHKATKD